MIQTHNMHSAITLANLKQIHNKTLISYVTIIKDFLKTIWFFFCFFVCLLVFAVSSGKENEEGNGEGLLLIFLGKDGENRN